MNRTLRLRKVNVRRPGVGGRNPDSVLTEEFWLRVWRGGHTRSGDKSLMFPSPVGERGVIISGNAEQKQIEEVKES